MEIKISSRCSQSNLVEGDRPREKTPAHLEKSVASEIIQLNPCAKQMAKRIGLGKALLLIDSQPAGKWYNYLAHVKCLTAERKTPKSQEEPLDRQAT